MLSQPPNLTPPTTRSPGTSRGDARSRLLITAGPTYEPIDAVRFIGNRSSGRLGVALADEGAARGWRVTLLLGPTSLTPKSSRVEVVRFQTASDLQGLLEQRVPDTDVLVMAAAVADYRPRPVEGKLRRQSGGLTLELEPTPDLLAGCARLRRPGQVFVGFALEPREGLLEAARAKMARKGVDMIVANPLETMDAADIEAVVVAVDGSTTNTPGRMSKPAFAAWLLDRIEAVAGVPTHGRSAGGA